MRIGAVLYINGATSTSTVHLIRIGIALELYRSHILINSASAAKVWWTASIVSLHRTCLPRAIVAPNKSIPAECLPAGSRYLAALTRPHRRVVFLRIPGRHYPPKKLTTTEERIFTIDPNWLTRVSHVEPIYKWIGHNASTCPFHTVADNG
jgi:hypothetical protein